MSHLFDDRAVEAAARVLARQYGYEHVWENDVGEEVYDREYWDQIGRDALNAALTALPREELIERAAAAIAIQYGRATATADDRLMADIALVAIGLIPEHVTEEGHE